MFIRDGIYLICLVCMGCTQGRMEVNDLRKVLFWESGHGGIVTVHILLAEGMEEGKVADAALGYLREDPSILDFSEPPSGRDAPDMPRGRDLWADLVARVKGVEFELPEKETDAERDQRIDALLAKLGQQHIPGKSASRN